MGMSMSKIVADRHGAVIRILGMACRVARKGPRRPPRKRESMDPDLTDLARSIADCQLDKNSKSWFEMPWRDSWNAVSLAATLATAGDRRPDDPVEDETTEALAFVRAAVAARASDTETYWRADEYIRLCAGAPMTVAALRCLQLAMSKSDGGGEVPSVVIRVAYDRLWYSGAHEEAVAEHRCLDAIGTSVELKGDGFDRVRRAFRVAWDRGLYRACYALPHIAQKGPKA